MRPFRTSLGLKLTVALVVFFVLLAYFMSAIITYGSHRTQDSATARSQEGLEELGELALLGMVAGQADYGGLAFEAASEIGFRAATYLETFQTSDASISVDTSLLAKTPEGVTYDANPNRITDLAMPNYVELTPEVIDEIEYTAALDAIVPALFTRMPDSVREENFDPIAISFIGANSTARVYPPIGVHDYVPPDLDLSIIEQRLGPGGNPERKLHWRTPYEDAAGRGLVMTVEVPVYSGDTYRGALQIDLSLARLVEEVEQLKLTSIGFAFYLDADGEVLDSNTKKIIDAEIEGGNTDLVAVLDAMRAGRTDVLPVTIDGNEMFVGFSPMEGIGGSLAVAASVEELTASASAITAGIEDEGQRTLRLTLLMMGALFVIGLIGATYLNRRVLIRPIETLVAATRSVAEGNFGTRIPVSGNDELAGLGHSFNQMTDNIQREVQEREAAQSELSALIAAMTDAVVVIDAEGRYVRVPATNAPAVLMPPEDLPGKLLSEVMPEGQADAFMETVREALTRQETITIEYPLVIDDWTYWFSAAVSPISHREVVVVARDITERVNARQELERQVEERTRELTALLRISSDLSSTLELRPLLQVIIEQLRELADFHRCSIFELEGDTMVILDSRATFTDMQLSLRIPTETLGPIWERMRQGESVISDDVHGDTALAAAYRAGAGDLIETEAFQVIHSCLGVPLTSKDRIIGMLVLAHMSPAFYTDRHARLVRAIATQIAVAIENARLYEQAQQLAQVEERQRLARELHDSVSQALYGIALGARTARTLLDSDATRAAEPMDYVLQLADAGLAEMRALIFELRPESLESEGLVAALEKQIAATRARYGIEVDADLSPEPSLSLAEKEVFYRVAQESLHNVVKHAHASRVHVVLADGDGEVRLEVRDNGTGFDATQSYPGHMGLVSFTERASSIGARVAVLSRPGEGTTVRLTLGDNGTNGDR